jgi:site-specific DNA-methyltransferase (adenine-specific)
MDTNRLYFGDCLEVMREDIPDESIDLIYLDPPFNSKRLYNAYLKSGAQLVAFKDTWRWHEAEDDFHDLAGDVQIAHTMEGLRTILGEASDLAYLSYMGNRLRECRRVLKQAGTIYLHCDPKMSHYLKVVMDGLFGRKHFRNEIIWCYRGGGVPKRDFSRKHDIIFRYSKPGRAVTFNVDEVRVPYSLESEERLQYPARSFRGDRVYDSYEPHPRGKHPEDWWQIRPVMPSAKERLYETQKPIPLLDRILRASSNPGDVVLDPFCGCGTTLHAAESLGRTWIGIDICVNACKVIEKRLRDDFPELWDDRVEYYGMPKTIDDAHELAVIDKFKFERWAASLVDGMEANKKQRKDKGIDGRGRFPIRKGVFIDIVSQVKGGSTGPSDVQAFNGARQQAGAELGIFTCFEEKVTTNMRDAAASAGRFMGVPSIQIYTIDDYFAGRLPKMPTARAA